MTSRSEHDHPAITPPLRKDLHMQHIELRLADVAERQALLRSHRDGRPRGQPGRRGRSAAGSASRSSGSADASAATR